MTTPQGRWAPHVVPGLVAAVVVVAVRLLLAVYSDEVLMFDEFRQGIYGHALRHEAPVHLIDVWFYPYEGWVIVHAWLVGLLGMVLPAEGMLVKVPTLLTGALQAWLLVWLAAQASGRWGAWLASLLVVGSPVAFTVLGVYGYGGHFESTVTEVAVIAAAVGWAQHPGSGRRRAILVGLLGAFAIFVHPAGLLGAATAIVVMFAGAYIVEHERPSEWRWALAASALGFALVVLLQNVLLDLPSTSIEQLYDTLIARDLDGQSSEPLVQRFGVLLSADLPHALRPWPFALVAGLGVVGAGFNLVHGVRHGSPAHVAASAFPVVLCIVGFVGTAAPGSPALMSMSLAYRYHLHVLPPLLLTLAVFLPSVSERVAVRGAVMAAVAGLAVWSLAVQLERVPSEAWTVERPRVIEADSTWMGRAELHRSVLEVCRGFTEPVQRGLCIRGLAMGEQLECTTLPLEERVWCHEGRGLALGSRMVMGALLYDKATMDGLADRVRAACAGPYEAVCMRAVGEHTTLIWPDLDFPEEAASVVREGAGMYLGTMLGDSPCFARARCDRWGAGHEELCREGVSRRVGQLASLRSDAVAPFTCASGPADPLAQAEGWGEGWGMRLGSEAAPGRCMALADGLRDACMVGLTRIAGVHGGQAHDAP